MPVRQSPPSSHSSSSSNGNSGYSLETSSKGKRPITCIKLTQAIVDVSGDTDRIVELDLSNSQLDYLPTRIYECRNLQRLILDNNFIEELPVEITVLSKLRELSVSFNCLTRVPRRMDLLKNLEKINLSRNRLDYLSPHWGDMMSIKFIDLSYNHLEQIPRAIQKGMANLETLIVSGNPNIDLSGRIWSRYLKTFRAEYCGKIHFPNWKIFNDYIYLDEMSFKNTKFHDKGTPTVDAKFHVKHLNVRACGLNQTSLQNVLGHFHAVENLRIDNEEKILTGDENYFSTLPIIHRDCVESMIEVNANSTYISSLPVTISTFINLRQIHLDNNCLNRLPVQIGHLKNLEALIANNNSLVELPDEIGSLTSLKVLEVSHNRINSLPPSIANLKKLQYLDLFDNDIHEIPSELDKLKSLQGLDLEFNFFETVDVKYPPSYQSLRILLRGSKESKRSREIGPRLRPLSPVSSVASSESEYWIHDEKNNSKDEQNEIIDTGELEDWDNDELWSDDWDPHYPPPIIYPVWPSPHYNPNYFCPADLHPISIREQVKQQREAGKHPPTPPIVEGQFDDAD